jgi:riboflavin kinase/FMN adenylyltransferase
MRQVCSFAEVHDNRPALVTVGVFDGIHRGHQALIGSLVQEAHAAGRAAVVVTFDPHPAEVLRGPQPAFYLTRPEERVRLIGELGVDWVVVHPFNLEVSHITAAEFVDSMVEHLHMRELWAGPDFALGHKRQGTVEYLSEQGTAKGFRVRVVEPRTNDGTIISSSAIRAALREGRVEAAAQYLGRPYSVSGTVVAGAKRGRAIGVPTANLDIGPALAYPAHGVYACRARLNGQSWAAATSVGVRPTFEATGLPIIEAHLIDFSGDLYGQPMVLEFLARLRPELKYDSVEALVEQMRLDIEQTREIAGAQAA